MLIVLFTNLSLFSQNISFEDANFKNALLSHSPKIDTDTDGEISPEEAKKFKGKLYLPLKGIKSLREVEYFVNITHLEVSKNRLTKLDVSKNTALTFLSVGSNQLAELDVSKNTALIGLKVTNCKLTKLDISKNTTLIGLRADLNQLTKLDISNKHSFK